MEEKTGNPALLYMPDISGFTQFVQETEISHSQHIIEELLETLIDANVLDLKISEIEGDAILFYKDGKIPSASEIANQSKRMFIAFHHQLRKYDLSRICDCGACSSASKLTLKIVAHVGEVSFSKIKDRIKLFGSDVILIHRLLKNKVEEHEYLMVTDSIPIETSLDAQENSWIQIMRGTEMYDVGAVNYFYSHFKSLYSLVANPQKPDYKYYRAKSPMLFSININAPMNFVYAQLMDLRNRAEVLPGIEGVEIEDEKHNKINKLGTVHNCIREPDQGPAITSDVNFGKNKMIFTETSLKNHGSFDYIVEKLEEEKSNLTFAVHIKFNVFTKLMFSLMMKKKFENVMHASCENIKSYNEKKYNAQKN
jgi:carbon monoxide dehydrogenase subunit G